MVLILLLAAVAYYASMEAFQRKRFSLMYNALVILVSWGDFTGDLVWMYQRFHDYRLGNDPMGFSFGVAAMTFLCSSVFLTAGAILYTASSASDDLDVHRTDSCMFTTMLLLSFTNPDLLIFFPFTEEAYTLEEGPFPNPAWVRVSLTRLVEDVPQFFLQVAFLATHDFDIYTFLNVLFTSIMVLYLVFGKPFMLAFIRGHMKLFKMWLMKKRRADLHSAQRVAPTVPGAAEVEEDTQDENSGDAETSENGVAHSQPRWLSVSKELEKRDMDRVTKSRKLENEHGLLSWSGSDKLPSPSAHQLNTRQPASSSQSVPLDESELPAAKQDEKRVVEGLVGPE